MIVIKPSLVIAVKICYIFASTSVTYLVILAVLYLLCYLFAHLDLEDLEQQTKNYFKVIDQTICLYLYHQRDLSLRQVHQVREFPECQQHLSHLAAQLVQVVLSYHVFLVFLNITEMSYCNLIFSNSDLPSAPSAPGRPRGPGCPVSPLFPLSPLKPLSPGNPYSRK